MTICSRSGNRATSVLTRSLSSCASATPLGSECSSFAHSKAESLYVVIKDDAFGLAVELDASCRFDSKLHGPLPRFLGSIWEAPSAPFASTGPKLDSSTCGGFRLCFNSLFTGLQKIPQTPNSSELINLKLAINSIDHRTSGRPLWLQTRQIVRSRWVLPVALWRNRFGGKP